jgi:hypothetical protein
VFEPGDDVSDATWRGRWLSDVYRTEAAEQGRGGSVRPPEVALELAPADAGGRSKFQPPTDVITRPESWEASDPRSSTWPKHFATYIGDTLRQYFNTGPPGGDQQSPGRSGRRLTPRSFTWGHNPSGTAGVRL